MLRRVVALLLALGPVVPAAEALVGPPADPHACTDHACFCAAARAARPASKACHGAPEGRDEAMRGACRHGAPAPDFTLGMPFVPLQPVLARVPDRNWPLIPTAAPSAGPGFTQLDTPPPRRG